MADPPKFPAKICQKYPPKCKIFKVWNRKETSPIVRRGKFFRGKFGKFCKIVHKIVSPKFLNSKCSVHLIILFSEVNFRIFSGNQKKMAAKKCAKFGKKSPPKIPGYFQGYARVSREFTCRKSGIFREEIAHKNAQILGKMCQKKCTIFRYFFS